jgi:hypothetical protein
LSACAWQVVEVTSACWDSRRLLVGTSDGAVCLRDSVTMRELASASTKAPHPPPSPEATKLARTRTDGAFHAFAAPSSAGDKAPAGSAQGGAKGGATGGGAAAARALQGTGGSRAKAAVGSAAARAAAAQGGEVTGVCFLAPTSGVGTGAGDGAGGAGGAGGDCEGAVAAVATAAGDLLVFEAAGAALRGTGRGSREASPSSGGESAPTTPELPLLR